MRFRCLTDRRDTGAQYGQTFGVARIVELATPRLAEVFSSCLDQALPDDIFTMVKLAGSGIENLGTRPVRWDVSLETLGDKWLGIVVPFIDNEAQEAVVDT